MDATPPVWACLLFNQVIAARRRDHLEVLHAVEHWKGSNGRPVTPELIGVNDVWDVVIHQQPFEKGLAACVSQRCRNRRSSTAPVS